MPAWLVSLVFHLVLLTLLGLFTVPGDPKSTIVLSTAVSSQHREGGQLEVETDDELELDLPPPPDMDLDNPQVRETIIKADQDARELRLDVDAPNLPEVSRVRQELSRSGRSSAALAARDPRLRVEMVSKEGGTTMTEAAVARGLRWLAAHQHEDGRWRLDQFHQDGGCSCGHRGVRADAAGTSLALLPFLGAGQTHLAGRYRQNVSRGLGWLLRNQLENGDLRAIPGDDERSKPDWGMYAHGQGAIVLCEAFLLTGDEQLRQPAQKAIDFIVAAQHAEGGWRYHPGQAGDTSVVGWQLMALQSARAAGLEVPASTFELAGQFLDTAEQRPNYAPWRTRWQRNGAASPRVQALLEIDRWTPLDQELLERYLEEDQATPEREQMWRQYQEIARAAGRYGYLPNRSTSPTMTAEALLCRMYLGWNKKAPGLMAGIDYLTEQNLPSESQPNIYYWYYGTQSMHHVGGRPWEKWNQRMRDILVKTQERSGHEAGSWEPRDGHGRVGGRIYWTALSVCTLEVYYRHLPIFRQIDLDAEAR